ncbi:MAG: nuclear transport factor 2 family protein [Desulfobacterales bacterium]|nr:nuclear transport factor 2 family protein [Desulfobacterales bacterium]
MSPEMCQVREVETCLMDLLHSVQQADIETYLSRVSPEVSCFEPESRGHLLRGLGLHRFLVEAARPVEKYHIELVDPLIRVGKDMAYVAYTLHLTELDGGKQAQLTAENVTRIFQREDGGWKMVHFHRS